MSRKRYMQISHLKPEQQEVAIANLKARGALPDKPPPSRPEGMLRCGHPEKDVVEDEHGSEKIPVCPHCTAGRS